jgi:hypothetical protein
MSCVIEHRFVKEKEGCISIDEGIHTWRTKAEKDLRTFMYILSGLWTKLTTGDLILMFSKPAMKSERSQESTEMYTSAVRSPLPSSFFLPPPPTFFHLHHQPINDEISGPTRDIRLIFSFASPPGKTQQTGLSCALRDPRGCS